MKCVHVIISGNVQGVGFRSFVFRNAKSLNIKGYVKNVDDDKVEAIFEGKPKAVGELIESCRKGFSGSTVVSVEVKEEKPNGEKDFKILY